MASAHVTIVLLYSSVAGTCTKNVLPRKPIPIPPVLSSDKSDPLISQPTRPPVALQLKVAVDPSVALTDVGVLRNSKQ